MLQPRPLSLRERLFVKMGILYSKKMYGDATPQFIEELIRSFGVKGFFEWGKQTDRVKEIMADEWDWFTGELLLGFGALWNGCTYCSRTHIAAANVYWHRDCGELFPISEDEVLAWQRLPDAEVLEKIKEALADDRYERTRRLLLRQHELKAMQAKPSDREDELVEMAIAAWDWATECSIVVTRDPVPPLSPIGKDKAAVAAYRAARGGPPPRAGIDADAGVTH